MIHINADREYKSSEEKCSNYKTYKYKILLSEALFIPRWPKDIPQLNCVYLIYYALRKIIGPIGIDKLLFHQKNIVP
jgi:hypothetical protein